MNFLDKLLTNTQTSNIMKICPLVAKLFCGYGVLRVEETDVKKIRVTFHNFANVPKKLRPSNIGIDIHLFECD
jgi:hypothetical protein